MSNARFSIIPSRAVYDHNMPDRIRSTLCALGMFSDKNGWCWPSLRTLAEIRNTSRSTISRDIKWLKEHGYLNVTPRYDDSGSRMTNMLQIKFDYEADATPPIASKDATPHFTLKAQHPIASKDATLINDPVNDPVNVSENHVRVIQEKDHNASPDLEDCCDTCNTELDNSANTREKYLQRTREALERGIARHVKESQSAQLSRWSPPKAIKALAETFVSGFGREPVGSEIRYWERVLKEFVQMGIEPQDISAALDAHEKANLAVKSPDSIRSAVWECHKKQKTPVKRGGSLGAVV